MDSSFTGYSGSDDVDTSVVRNQSAGAIVINATDVTGTISVDDRLGGSSSTVNVSVPMDFHVIDKDNVAISGVQITAFKVSDDTSVMTATDTDGSGDVSTTFSGTTPVDIYYRARKASGGGTNYVNFSAFGTIAAITGISVTITMQEDVNNAT